MKNPFDPINNHDEWIQNDWESDDFIENQNSGPRPEPGPGATKIAWIITIALFITFYAVACAACS